jgi:hypothetical protein
MFSKSLFSGRMSKSARTRKLVPSALAQRRSARPRLEFLEQRTLLNTDMVTSDGDTGSGTLRTVIANAAAGDIIEFNMSDFTSPITLTSGVIDITKNLSIEGPGASVLSVSGNSSSQIFAISSGENVTVSGLTLTEGSSSKGGALANNGGKVHLDLDVIESNVGTSSGGAIANPSGSLSMSGCLVSDNHVESYGSGGLYIGGGVVTIESSTFTANNCVYDGGAIAVRGGSLNLIDSTLASNVAGAYGGGAYVYPSVSVTANLFDSTIADNTAGAGGGVLAVSADVTSGNTIVADNSATTGPDFYGSVSTDLGSNLIGNTSHASGFDQSTDLLNVSPAIGSLGNNGGPTETIPLLPGSPAIDAGTNSVVPAGLITDQRGYPRFANGTTDIGAFEVQTYVVTNTNDNGAGSLRAAMTNANVAGGSIIDVETTGTISLASSLAPISSDVSILGLGANELSVNGQGLYQALQTDSGVTASISGLTITDSSNASGGGGVQNSGTLTLTNCAFTDDSTSGDGGGINNEGGATLTLLGCTVSGDFGNSDGGGIENSGTLTVVNSTIANNTTANGNGGGIDNNGALTIVNSTIADNIADDAGGGIDTAIAALRLSLANTLVGDNTSGEDSGSDLYGSVTTDSGNNLVGNDSGAAGLTQSSDVLNVNPLLSTLGSYGGTMETITLLPGSPAIDAGSNLLAKYDYIPLATDERGYPRVVNGIVDIGADECQGFVMVAATGNDQSAPINTIFADSLGAIVTSRVGEPVVGGTVTFNAPDSGASVTFPYNGGSDTATIGAGGIADMTVSANGVTGSYNMIFDSKGTIQASYFSLTNADGLAAQLQFQVDPSSATYGDAIPGTTDDLAVEVLDASGDLDTSSTAPVTIEIDNNPTGGTLGGTVTVDAVAGIATFNDLTINKVGTGYTLEGTSNGLNATPASTPFDILQRALTITAVANAKTYDGTTSASLVPEITAGSLVSGDTAEFIDTYSTANAGTGLALTPSGIVNDGNDGGNYSYNFVPANTGSIARESLTITAVAYLKTYDVSTTAPATPIITSGKLQGSDTADFTEAYTSPNAGTGLTITPSGSVADGNDGDNYSYNFVSVSTGTILPEALTITAVTNTKIYNATTSAAAVPTITSGSLQGEDTADFIETYSNPNVGIGSTLTPSGSVDDGNQGKNYSYTFVPVSSGTITARLLTITAVANSKTYNASTSAAAVPTITSGAFQGDDTADFSEAYSGPNAGTGLTLTPSGSVDDGNGGNNYSYTFVPVATGVISPKSLTITAVPLTKVYDSTTNAAGVPTVAGLVGSDTVTGLSEAFASTNAGSGKAILVASYTVNDGNHGQNYTANLVRATNGVITPAPLTITAAFNLKTYDGTVSALALPAVSGLKGSDTVTNLTETYATATAGTGKTLNVATYTVNDGNHGANYAVTTVPNDLGAILAPPPPQLSVDVQPSAAATAGQAIAPQPVVDVLNADGSLDTSDNTTVVTASILGGGGSLGGTTSVTVAGGVATFTNLVDISPGSIVLLFTASDATLTQSSAITVSPGPPPVSTPPPSGHTPPTIIQVSTAGGHRTPHAIVLRFNQAIDPDPVVPMSAFAVDGQDAHGVFDAPVKIKRMTYDPFTHTIKLFVPTSPPLNGTYQLTVNATEIVNKFGQQLAGDGSTAGTNFVSLIDLPWESE